MANRTDKLWGLFMPLGRYQPRKASLAENFDGAEWDRIVDEAAASGLNAIVLDIGDGVAYRSHPEISYPDAWSHTKVREEIAHCRERGLTLFPALNFSACHSGWLGEYRLMISTPTYYRVVSDIIAEVAELFDRPAYFHIGFDEEDAKHCPKDDVSIFRTGKRFFGDLRFIVDCVKEEGVTPWIWADPLFDHPDGYKEHFDPSEIVLSPWYYNAFRKEHYTPVSSRAEYVAYYNEGEYAKMGLKFVEEDPFLVRVREVALPLAGEGFSYIPCASVYNRCVYNTEDLVEYFRDGMKDAQLRGFITAPWCDTTVGNHMYFEESFRYMKEAKEKFY